MRTHPLNCNIALPDSLGDLGTMRRQDGVLSLTDDFRTYSGAIYKSPPFDELAASFDYEKHGYSQLLQKANRPQRAPTADYIHGELGPVRQMTFDFRLKDLPVENLDPDLQKFEPVWKVLFNRFAELVSPAMGKNFEIRLKVLNFAVEDFHTDKHVVGILPLGKERESTICTAEKPEPIRSKNSEFVITTPLLKHSGPVSLIPRIGLGVTKYDHQII